MYIGSQNNNIPVLGRYTHARALLPRLKYFVDNYGNEKVIFGGTNGGISVTIEELADEFVEQMDLIYYYIINGTRPDDDDTQWQNAKNLFLNPTGYSDGGSAYGIILNGLGTGVVSFGRRQTHTSNITVKNVEIYGIHNQPWERFWATYHGSSQMQGFFFDSLGMCTSVTKKKKQTRLQLDGFGLLFF